MQIHLIEDKVKTDIHVTDNGVSKSRIPGVSERTITVSVDNEGADHIYALIKYASDEMTYGCSTGDMCVWDTTTGLHRDGSPCLYVTGETPND